MSYADATLSQEHLQPRRIAATSVAIAVHVAVLMMLMMPASVPTTASSETVTTIDWIVPTRAPPPPPPPPPRKPDAAKPQTVEHPTIPIREEVVQAADQTANAMSTQATNEIVSPPTSFNTDIGVSSGFVELGVLAGPAPAYPRMAIQRHIQGTVMLRVHVDANGKPIEVSIEQSSGSRILDEAAQKFVQARWLFVPAKQNGQATEAWGLVPVQFVLQ